MTLEQFLEKLKATPRNWYITERGLIRIGDIGTEKYACPLGELAGTGLSWLSAGSKLGIDFEIGKKIKDAADFESTELRPQLLEACGLKE